MGTLTEDTLAFFLFFFFFHLSMLLFWDLEFTHLGTNRFALEGLHSGTSKTGSCWAKEGADECFLGGSNLDSRFRGRPKAEGVEERGGGGGRGGLDPLNSGEGPTGGLGGSVEDGLGVSLITSAPPHPHHEGHTKEPHQASAVSHAEEQHFSALVSITAQAAQYVGEAKSTSQSAIFSLTTQHVNNRQRVRGRG